MRAVTPSTDSRKVEDPIDLYFFHPLGRCFTKPAAALGVTPTQVTILSMFVGLAGAVMLFDLRLALLGFALLIFYSILDSTDGQLARMTGQVTPLGRVLDGVIGYAVYAAIYPAIALGLLERGENISVLLWMLLAAISNIPQAQQYEFFKHQYAMIVRDGRIEVDDPAHVRRPWMRGLFRAYLAVQKSANARHERVLSRIADRAEAGLVQTEDRVRYQKYFCGTRQGWNWLGDNLRFGLIGLAAYLQRMELFFFAILLLNLLLLFLWLSQRRADREFLNELQPNDCL